MEPATITRCPDIEELSDFIVGNLPEAAFARVAGHVESCAECEARLQQFEACSDDLVTQLRQPAEMMIETVPPGLLSAAKSARAPRGPKAWLAGQGSRRLGKFELLQELGLGSFGYVFRARDTELDRTVAIKVLRAGRLASQEDVDRFMREARAAAQLKHPGIVAIYETGQTDEGTCYLVEEFIQGETLAARLAAGRFDFRQIAELTAAIADALDYAHQHGVIHRDISPSNIMLDVDARPHLMDFGLAKREAEENPMTPDGLVMGTPAYMSPEQARGDSHQVDARSDIYSVGVILYELLTGERPFGGNRRMLMLQVLQDEPRPPRRLNDRVPRDLETICLKAMAKSAGRRYASAGELAGDLRRYLNGEPIHARPVGNLERLWSWSRRRPALAALVAVSILATALLVSVLAISNVRITREQQYTLEALQRETKAKDQLLQALIQNARLTSDALIEFNTLYASEVVARVRDHVEVTHDYANKKGAIPLPATMSVELGKRIGDRASGMQVRLYSDKPFPWREKEGGPKDDFEREALRQLRVNPDQPFYRFEDWRGRASLRYATASRMQASCLNCHNTHPESPKTDWKEGDVRGVFEVIFPVDSSVGKPGGD